MATKGSTYAQEMPEGVKKHREHVKDMTEAAKARRAKKGRGNGTRYKYDGGITPVVPKGVIHGVDSDGNPVSITIK